MQGTKTTNHQPSALWPNLGTADVSLLQATATTLESAGADGEVHWFPEYGAALMVLCGAHEHPDGDIRAADELTLLLVGLDSWKFQTHR